MKLETPEMHEAIEQDHDPAKFYHFSNEHNLIYKIIFDMTAKKLKEEMQLNGYDSLRDYLDKDQIKLVTRLQKYNTILIEDGFNFHERKEKLKSHCERLKVKLLRNK